MVLDEDEVLVQDQNTSVQNDEGETVVTAVYGLAIDRKQKKMICQFIDENRDSI